MKTLDFMTAVFEVCLVIDLWCRALEILTRGSKGVYQELWKSHIW